MSAAGARAATGALVRVLGGDAVIVRFPSPPLGAANAEELGLGSPEFHDVVLSPVLVRVRQARTTVLVAAHVMETALGLDGAGAVQAALLASSFVGSGDAVLRVDAVERCAVFGRAYLYRLRLREPAAKGAAA